MREIREQYAKLVMGVGGFSQYRSYRDLPIISPNNRHVAIVLTKQEELSHGQVKKEYFVLWDIKEGKLYDFIEKKSPVFSPDSQHLAYIVRVDETQEHKKYFLVLDGTEGEKYDGIDQNSLIWSPDSQRLAYVAWEEKDRFLVVDGKEFRERRASYSGCKENSFVWSPDSQRFAYVTETKGKLIVVLDGKARNPYDNIMPESLAWGPDSQHLAYWAFKDNEWFVVVEGKKRAAASVMANPDHKDMPWRSEETTKNSIILTVRGEQRTKFLPSKWQGKIIFDGPEYFHYLILQDNSFSLVEEKISPRETDPQTILLP